ncbi:MAG TPA: glucosaminidase domain-containing protein [Hyphomicrobium sp.]|nr:glucosaminidase domain-containing protein [Hyphomicrobium sp.]
MGVAFVAALLALPAAAAADMPPIKTSATNHVVDCATPGRLMAYVRERNPKLNARYDGLASAYMRQGEELNVRWDYAFFQMLLETGYLNYGGDVKPDQNNFAGLGATGRGARGERFSDISTGARAHLEHLVMYSGERIENPVAERTRNIQEWGVLTNWQKGISGPITFTQLAKQWAPTSRRYAVDIEAIADRFFDGICKQDDPQPELVAEIRGTPVRTASADVASKTPGQEAQRRAVEAAKAEGGATRASLGAEPKDDVLPAKGAAAVAAVAAEAKVPAQTASMSPPLKVLNAAPADQAPVEAHAPEKDKDAGSPKTANKTIEVAALPGGGAVGESTKASKPGKVEKKEAAPAGKCRVWTASYGGSKAIVIKASQDKTVNYTVLDVNEGSEKREADAYINAYAKGGQSVGEFSSQSQALEKAFELCPEG